MAHTSSFIVRVSDKVTADSVLDLRVFPDEQEEQAIGFALDVFRNCPEVNVMVFSVEKNVNIVSLFR